jgi:hypothetical protein
VYAYYKKYDNWDPPEVDEQVFSLFPADQTDFTPVDPVSIMMYGFPADFTTNGFSTPWNTELSQTDKDYIRKAYPGRP